MYSFLDVILDVIFYFVYTFSRGLFDHKAFLMGMYKQIRLYKLSVNWLVSINAYQVKSAVVNLTPIILKTYWSLFSK